MPSIIRTSPPVSLWVSMVRLIGGSLRLSRTSIGQILKMEDGEIYQVFRHIRMHPEKEVAFPITFIVRFKFSRLSHRANKIASIIPMFMISGFPGFQMKMYGVNKGNGYWTGMYQWESEDALEEYKRSFVFRVMKRRAIDETVTTLEIPDHRLQDYIENRKA